MPRNTVKGSGASDRERTPINENEVKKNRSERLINKPNNKMDTIENINITKLNEPIKYNRYDKGPFIVIVDKKDLNQYKLSRDLKLNNIKAEVIDQFNKRKAKLIFKLWHEANKLINNELLNNDYKCFIPEMYVHTVGIIRGLPLDITTREIENNYSCSENLVKAERMTKWNFEKKQSEEIEMVKLTFRSRELPEKIKIYEIYSKIDYYVPNPIFCTNCLNFGHKQKFCAGRTRCNICANFSEEILEDESKKPHECENKPICKHCGPGHKTNDPKSCNERKRQRKISRYMVMNKIPYIEALKQFNKEKPKTFLSDINFPNPIWITNQSENTNENLEKLNKQIDTLKNEKNYLISFFNKIQQMIIHSSPNNVSNDIILNDIGIECNEIINILQKN